MHTLHWHQLSKQTPSSAPPPDATEKKAPIRGDWWCSSYSHGKERFAKLSASELPPPTVFDPRGCGVSTPPSEKIPVRAASERLLLDIGVRTVLLSNRIGRDKFMRRRPCHIYYLLYAR
jgi:hypothetical protein